MVNYFRDNSTRPTRAYQAWLILISKASNRQTLTYTMLDDLMNFGSRVGLGKILDYIWTYCSVNELPPLTILVVSKGDGTPSSGMGEYDYSQQEKVFEFDWYSIVPPTPEELEKAFKAENG